MKEFNNIILKIGEELGIKVTFLSDFWTTVLEKNGKTRYITGYQFDLNSHALGNVLDDKGLFYDLLKYKNIPVIEQYVIFKDYDKEEVLNYFYSHNKEIVIKGNIGNAGKEVFKVIDEKNLFLIIDKLFLKQFSVSLCPYYHIKNEYRIIVLDNAVRNIFGKVKPIVIGDGIKSVRELAKEYNDYFISHEEKIENPDYVPLRDEAVDINFKFNLSSGAKSFTDIPVDLKNKLIDLAIKVSKELNIMFASVDIIYTESDELLVMETNSGVTMNKFIIQNDNGYDIAYSIYRDAVKLMFK